MQEQTPCLPEKALTRYMAVEIVRGDIYVIQVQLYIKTIFRVLGFRQWHYNAHLRGNWCRAI